MRTTTTLGSILLLSLPTLAQDSLMEAYQRGTAAAEQRDGEAYLAAMDETLALRPGHPALRRHRAQALAMLERSAEAIRELDRLIDSGATFAFDRYPEFEELLATSEGASLLERQRAAREPFGEMTFGLRLAEDLIPEGIAYDSTEDLFYVSSVAQRKIVGVTRDGEATDFIAPGEHGYLGGLGLAVDVHRRRLWAVSDAAAGVRLFDGDTVGDSAVHCFDLEDGTLLYRYVFEPQGEVVFGLGDVAVESAGSAILTGSENGCLVRVAVGQAEPQEILPAGSIVGANGIALSADGEHAFVSRYAFGIDRVHLATGELVPAASSGDFTTAGVDGLYLDGQRLIAIQNGFGLDRVAVFPLDDAGRIVACEVLVARQPLFEDPTTGAVVNGEFWFIANSRVQPFFAREDPARLTGWGRAQVMRVGL